MAYNIIVKDRPGFSRLSFYATLFLASGSAGLIYQVVWEKLLQLYFGVSTLSITLIIAAFLCGLGLGSFFGGFYSRKIKSPLAAYGYLEIGIGLFGLISPILLILVGRITAGSPYPAVFLLSFLLLLIPTLLMGATLPFLSQTFVQRVETSGRVIGILYGINTFGGALGALISGYLLISWLGLDGAIYAAVALNIVIGIVALWYARLHSSPPDEADRAESMPAVKKTSGWSYHTILTAALLTGFIGLGYEMLWIRVLFLINKHSAYNFPTVLFVYLTALALGSYLFGKKADRSERPAELFWKVELLVGILAAVSFLLFWWLIELEPFRSVFAALFMVFQRPAGPYLWMDQHLVFSWRTAIKDMLLYLIPPLLLIGPAGLVKGGSLPILDRIAIESPAMAGRRVGDVHLANIMGAVLGTLLIGLVFLPQFGTEWTLKLLVAGSLVFILLNLFEKEQSRRLQLEQAGEQKPTAASLERGLPHVLDTWRVIIQTGGLRISTGRVAIILVLLLTVFLPGDGKFYEKIFRVGTGLPVTLVEGRDGVLAFSGLTPTQPPQHLWIGGEINSFFPTGGIYESRDLACAGASQPQKVLVIGLGGANTAYFFSQLSSIEAILVVELLQNLGPFLAQHLDHAEAVLEHPKVKLLADDGRRYLYANPDEKFDLITMDPLRHYTAGHNNLYSREAFHLYRERLDEQGVLCAWIDEHHSLPQTAASAFPYVDEFNDFLIASSAPITYDFTYMQVNAQSYREKSQAVLGADAEEALNPAQVLKRFYRAQDQIKDNTKGDLELYDLKPQLEYYYLRPPVPPGDRKKGAALAPFLSRIQGCSELCQAQMIGK